MSGKKIPLIWGVLMIVIGVWTIFGMTSGIKYLIGVACLFAGWHSLKAAVFMSDTEIDEVNQYRENASKKTYEKFKDL